MSIGPLLAVDRLVLCRGGRDLLRGVTLRVAAGEVAALMGLSGSGKTRILRATAALEAFDAGVIDVAGFRLEPGPLFPESKLRPLRRKLGLVFQAHALFENWNALENVTLAPRYAAGRSASEAKHRAWELLESLGVADRAAALTRELSGGEAQRVAIARALALDPSLLLMDEPTAALDPARRGSLGEVLRRLAAQGRGLLIATHDVDFAGDFADRVLVLSGGAIAEEGNAREILKQPRHPATRQLLAGDS